MHDHHNHESETLDVHGMLLFGGEPLYFSHLPMFRHPAHRFQVLMEVDFGETVMKGDDLHTFVPEPFDILHLEPGGAGLTSIPGTVFRGHFERGGTPVAQDVTARVQRVAHFRRLDPAARHDGTAPLRYLCFGRPGGLHLAHEITARPDFDQVLEVRLATGPQDFGTPVPVTFERVDTPGRRLRAGDRAEATFPGGTRALVEVVREVYMETGDLT